MFHYASKENNCITNIQQGKCTLLALTNGGHPKSKDEADTKHFGQVWFNKKSFANMLSLADAIKYARVTIYSSVTKSMFVHLEDRFVMEFKQYKYGLYYFDVAEQGKQSNISSDINYNYLSSFSLIQTVEENKNINKKKKVKNAKKSALINEKSRASIATRF